jgi:DNA polymerase III delta prime subunit
MQITHHAYLLTGSPEEALSFFGALLLEHGIVRENNPDYFVFDTETFGIDDARRLSELSLRKAFGEKKVFLVHPERYTLEAQNALLKTLEEPTAGTHIFLIAREKEMLIPTLLSRMQIVEVGGHEEGAEADKFLKLSVPQRLEFAKKFSDEAMSLPAFLDNILQILGDKVNPKTLNAVLELRQISEGRAVHEKLILEHLAFVL